MLTRLAVKGFKNLLDVQVEFGPFTCIAGANGIGKSNVFDAIEFLSYLAADNFVEAAQKVRSASGARGGDPRDLFWNGYRDDHERRMTLTAEMIVPLETEDDLGTTAPATTTLLRYQLILGYAPPEGAGSVGRLTLLSEELHPIRKGDAARHLRFPHHAGMFRDALVVNRRTSGAPFLSTEERDVGTVINVHGDGGSHGRPQPRAASRAGRTVISTMTTNDYPTLLAARREMQSWRRLALEPSALRAPDGFTDPRYMGIDGRHLAAALYRIAHDASAREADSEAVYAQVADRLSDLAGVGVDRLTVDPDPTREVFTLFLYEKGGLRFPARSLSEGTLRFLALCVLLEDPTFTGLVCMEEPENGIHPANLGAMVDLVRDLAVDPHEPPDALNPFRQVIINTHSPGVVRQCDEQDLVLADATPQRAPDGGLTRALTLLPFRGSWRARSAEGPSFTRADILAYLTVGPGSHLQLPMDLVV